MDPVSATSVAFGVIGLAGQLLTTGMQCYAIFSDAKDFSVDHDSFSWELETERERLIRWEAIWGVDNDGLRQKLDPGDRRYRYAVGTLARILALFADVDSLGTKYGIRERNTVNAGPCPSSGGSKSKVRELDAKGGRRRDRFLSVLSHSRSRSRSRENIATKSETGLCGFPKASIPVLGASGLKLLENPSVLQDENLIPGLSEEIRKLSETAIEMQKLLPTYRKLQWAIVDKARASQLVEQLRKYNDGLFSVLPEPGRVDSGSAASPTPFSKFNVPFRLPVQRNKNFKGREDLLEKIHNILKPDKIIERRVAVLHGLGGMGKSQMSIEYAYRYQDTYTSIFWIDATSQATLARSALLMAEQLVVHYETKWGDSNPDYVRIGVMLGLPGCVEPTGQIAVKGEENGSGLVVKAMEKWLSSGGNSNWLVIFENNDDIECVKLQDFVPTGEFGSVIITTRRPEVSYLGVGIEVVPVDKDVGVSILLASAGKDSKSTSQEDLAEAEMVAERLGYFPLALNQAGGYMAAMQMPLKQYLPLYTTNFKRVVSTNIPTLANYRNDTFFTTWQISFNALPLPASELLLLCAFLGNQNIVEEVLQRGRDTITWLGKDEDLIHDALKPLLSFSFAKRNSEPDRFIFHPLVLEWARESLDITGRKRKAKESIILVGKILDYEQDGKSTADWMFESRIMTHIDMALQNFREYFLSEFTSCALGKDIVDAVENIGDLCRFHDRMKDAEEIIGKVLTNRQKASIEGDGTVQIFKSFNSMGKILVGQGRYEEALGFFEKALAGREKVLGEECPDTLDSLSRIASVFRFQGNFKKALEMYERVLAITERVLGKEDRRTLAAVGFMAGVLSDQKQYEEALILYKRVLAGQEKVLGEEHPDVLLTVGRMALSLHDHGQHEEAFPLSERALAGLEKALGKDHRNTIYTVYVMAYGLQIQGRYEVALPLYQRILVSYEKSWGKGNRKTLNVAYNIALIYDALGQYEGSRDLFQRVFDCREKMLGKEHPDTVIAARNLSRIHKKLSGEQEKVEKRFQWRRLRLHAGSWR